MFPQWSSSRQNESLLSAVFFSILPFLVCRRPHIALGLKLTQEGFCGNRLCWFMKRIL